MTHHDNSQHRAVLAEIYATKAKSDATLPGTCPQGEVDAAFAAFEVAIRKLMDLPVGPAAEFYVSDKLTTSEGGRERTLWRNRRRVATFRYRHSSLPEGWGSVFSSEFAERDHAARKRHNKARQIAYDYRLDKVVKFLTEHPDAARRVALEMLLTGSYDVPQTIGLDYQRGLRGGTLALYEPGVQVPLVPFEPVSAPSALRRACALDATLSADVDAIRAFALANDVIDSEPGANLETLAAFKAAKVKAGPGWAARSLAVIDAVGATERPIAY